MVWLRGMMGVWGLCAVLVVTALALGDALPPGDVIAFERYRRASSDLDIYLYHHNTRIDQRLTDTNPYRYPRWSPNTRHLTYTGPYDTVYQHIDGEQVDITRRIFPDDIDPTASFVWSPDGCCVAYLAWNDRDNGHEIHVLHLESRQHWAAVDTVVLSQTSPAWSPDGRTLAFMGYLINSGRPPRIYTVPIDTQANPQRQVPSVVTDGFEGYAYPVWSPDGSHIYFIRALDTQLMRVRVDGSIKQPEEFEAVGNIQPNGAVSFSPDGTKLVFSARDAWGYDALFTADVDGTQHHQLTFPVLRRNAKDRYPVWRP
jgi:Tol biopolymer transport system component